MLEIHDRAFKEWAVVCEAMKAGRQTVLIRKGGIREEDGIFRMDDAEFFLMPTYDHQAPHLLKTDAVEELERVERAGYNPRFVTISAYATVEVVAEVGDELLLRALDREHVWNEQYIKMRLDYNPYDPLYVILLRVYCLPEATTLPMLPEYGGCKSWVTLDRAISTIGATPAVTDEDFGMRRRAVLEIVSPSRG
jgi:hypothetical protein